jgi:hypothetical protein
MSFAAGQEKYFYHKNRQAIFDLSSKSGAAGE